MIGYHGSKSDERYLRAITSRWGNLPGPVEHFDMTRNPARGDAVDRIEASPADVEVVVALHIVGLDGTQAKYPDHTWTYSRRNDELPDLCRRHGIRLIACGSALQTPSSLWHVPTITVF